MTTNTNIDTHTPAHPAAYLALELDARPQVVRNTTRVSPSRALGVFLKPNEHTLRQVVVVAFMKGCVFRHRQSCDSHTLWWSINASESRHTCRKAGL